MSIARKVPSLDKVVFTQDSFHLVFIDTHLIGKFGYLDTPRVLSPRLVVKFSLPSSFFVQVLIGFLSLVHFKREAYMLSRGNYMYCFIASFLGGVKSSSLGGMCHFFNWANFLSAISVFFSTNTKKHYKSASQSP